MNYFSRSYDGPFQNLSALVPSANSKSPFTIRLLVAGFAIAASIAFCQIANAQPNPTPQWTWMGGSNTVPNCGGDCGQPGWYGTQRTPSAMNVPQGRMSAVSWTDKQGNLWLFGGGGATGSLNDLWKFDTSTSEWTWMSGNSTLAYNPAVGSGEPGVYGTLGSPAPENKPGSRFDAQGWTDKSGNLWLFGGYGFDSTGQVNFLNDLWKFDPSTNEWTWMGGDSTLPCLSNQFNFCFIRPSVYGTLGTPAAGNAPGGLAQAATWTDANGNFWLFGGHGGDAGGGRCYLNDLWEFNPTSNEWTWWGGGQLCPGIDAGMSGSPRSLRSPASWTDSAGNLWMFGGILEDTNAVAYYVNDLAKFDPSIDQWSVETYSDGFTSYSPLGVWSPSSYLGARYAAAHWTDNDGNFWLLGGMGATRTSSSFLGMFNDLWEFKPSINEWAWMGGNQDIICLKSDSFGGCASYGQPGVYGTRGTPASENAPGARYFAANWTDSKGNLWLFGGHGVDAQGNGGYLNDLWQYSLAASPSVSPAPAADMPSFSPAPGTYTSAQTLMITDQTPSTVIYYTTDGTMPNADSPVYSGPITVSSTVRISAIAVTSGYAVSSLASATYTINYPPVATPTFSVPAGTYLTAQTVTISDTNPNAAIYFTTDGSTPTTSSTLYTGPITVSSTQTIQAIAVASGYANSAIASASYTINLNATFTLQASPSSITLRPSSVATFTLTVTPQDGFNFPVSFTCSGLPSGFTYSFSPTTVTPSGAAVSALLAVTLPSQSTISPPNTNPFLPLTAFNVAVCVFILRKKSVSKYLLLMVALAGLGIASGCGGKGKSIVSSPQPYTTIITVTATGQSIQQSTSVSLTME
jgi:N-acetylneuraminic acid mutarotase